jgi:hypothetical protein
MKSYAFIKNNVVVNIALFDDNVDQAILDFFAQESNVDLLVLTDNNAYIGGDYIEEQFRSACLFSSWIWDKVKKEWVAPISMPDDDKSYYWNEELLNWEEISE